MSQVPFLLNFLNSPFAFWDWEKPRLQSNWHRTCQTENLRFRSIRFLSRSLASEEPLKAPARGHGGKLQNLQGTFVQHDFHQEWMDQSVCFLPRVSLLLSLQPKGREQCQIKRNPSMISRSKPHDHSPYNATKFQRMFCHKYKVMTQCSEVPLLWDGITKCEFHLFHFSMFMPSFRCYPYFTFQISCFHLFPSQGLLPCPCWCVASICGAFSMFPFPKLHFLIFPMFSIFAPIQLAFVLSVLSPSVTRTFFQAAFVLHG